MACQPWFWLAKTGIWFVNGLLNTILTCKNMSLVCEWLAEHDFDLQKQEFGLWMACWTRFWLAKTWVWSVNGLPNTILTRKNTNLVCECDSDSQKHEFGLWMACQTWFWHTITRIWSVIRRTWILPCTRGSGTYVSCSAGSFRYRGKLQRRSSLQPSVPSQHSATLDLKRLGYGVWSASDLEQNFQDFFFFALEVEQTLALKLSTSSIWERIYC